MTSSADDVEALRKELGMVKDKAKAYISRLNEEKAALAKELNEKSTVLAGVKDKTKAYVEKLNAEKAAAIAALEDQVEDRDGRLLKAKELLQTSLASKDGELEAAKADAQTLRDRLAAAKAEHAPELNGDAAGPEAAQLTSDLSAEVESLKEELKNALEACKALESSKMDVENLLAGAKQEAHETQERLAEVERECASFKMERDEAYSRVETLQASVTKAEEAARASEEATEAARQEAEVRLEEARREAEEAAATAVEHEQIALASLEQRLEQAEAASAAASAAQKTELEELRLSLASSEAAAAEAVVAADKKIAEAAAAAALETEKRAGEAANAGTAELDSTVQSLVEAEAEVSRLRGELEQAAETAATAAAKAKVDAEAAAAEAAAGREELLLLRKRTGEMETEVADFRERVRVADEAAAAAAAEAAAPEMVEVAETSAANPEEAGLGVAEDGEGHAGANGSMDGAVTSNTADAEGDMQRADTAAVEDRIASLEEELASSQLALRETREELVSSKESLRKSEEAEASGSQEAGLMTTAAVEQARQQAEQQAKKHAKELSQLELTNAEAAKANEERVASLEEEIGSLQLALQQAKGELLSTEESLRRAQEAEASEKATAAAAVERAVREAERHAEERAQLEQASGEEIASLKDAVSAAEAVAERSRAEAGTQAGELSSRLMGALEEREEGRRREAAASREVVQLKGELTEAVAGLEKAREDAAAAESAATGRAEELARKVEEAEKKAEAAESGAVGVVKSLEEALTQREQEGQRLKEEAAGLRKEALLLKAELEARGEALRQAKVDLASVLENAGTAGKEAEELRKKLQSAVAEHVKTKMRLESESAANEGLKAAVIEANETVSKRVDGLREALEKAEAERDSAKASVSSSNIEVKALQAQVASLLRESAGAKTEAGLKVGELQQRLSEAENELSREREAISERKKEMQAYADAMAKEGQSLRAAAKEAQAVVASATAGEREAKSAMEQVRQRGEVTAVSLRQTMEKQRADAAQALAALEERNQALESETYRLQQTIALESGQREEKTQGLEHSLLDKIEEANLHKKKRLAARSEMISLAKTLETERDGHKAVGHALQYGLVPKAIEQATTLEHVVRLAERSVHSLSRASGVRLATNLQAAHASLARLRGRVAGADDPGMVLQQRQASDLSRVALMAGGSVGGPEDANSSGLSDRLDSPLGSAASGDQAWQGAGKGRLTEQAARDCAYLERVRRLESEMERVSSGLALVSQSVEQLSELAEIQAGLCGGFSVLCCPTRKINSGARRGGGGGGPAYTMLEMGSQRLVEAGEERVTSSGGLGRHNSNDSGELIRR